jgi:type IV secretion system protein VirD4
MNFDPVWRYGIAITLIAICTTYLFLQERRFITETYGFRILPPGWGSLQPKSAMGAGRFLSLLELLTKFRWQKGGIFLGRPLPQQRPFGLFKRSWVGPSDDRHMLTVAGTRIGKGTGALIPNLLLYPGSALVIDPKGELAQITSARRGSGSARVKRCLQQTVHILDPEDQVPGRPKARWNPLAELDPSGADLVARIQKIAFALVPPEPNSQDQFFINQSRDLLTMLILHVMTAEPPERHNLIHVRRLLAQGDTELFQFVNDECKKTGQPVPYKDATEALLNYMSQNPAHGGKVSGFGQRLVALPEDTRNTIVSDLYGRTSFLDHAGLEHMLQGSDFTLKDLKLHPTTVYVCMKGTSLATNMKPIAYILIDMAIAAMEDAAYKPPHSVLFAMDEFYMLGRHESIDRAMGLIAGFHVKLWPVIQSLDQLQQHYPATWDNFIRNCGAVQYAGDQKPNTIQDLEKRVGDIVTKAKDGSVDRQPLLSCYELSSNYFEKTSRRQLVFFQQQPAAPLEFVDYYNQPWLNALAEKITPVQNQPATGAWALQGRSIKTLKGP